MPHLTQEQGSDLIVAEAQVAVNPGYVEAPGSYIFRIGRIVIASLDVDEDEAIPAWDGEVTYAKGALVRFNSRNFISRVAGNQGNEPPAEGEDESWQQQSLVCTLPEAFAPEVEIVETGKRITTTGEVHTSSSYRANRSWRAAKTSP